ncbi:MAG TPA: BatD family protein [Elusimicrobiota bacterium]|nr:BatD family protein [Elusimicrobiota bacterium]
MRALFPPAVLCAAALAAAAAPAAAAVQISAELSRPQVVMGDQLSLAVTVEGDQASLPSPKLPPLDAFSVYDSGRSQSLNFVNGKVSSSVVYTYVLSPRQPGKFKIPPITADGAAAPTAPLDVEVLTPGSRASAAPGPAQGAAPPGTGPAPGAPAPRAARARSGAPADVFVTASVDRPRAYVNQQVTLTVRFLNAVQLLGDLRYDAPETTGFLAEELPPVRNGMTQIDGRAYQFSEIKVALFPIQSGKLTIGPAVIHCQIARMGADAGQDFFDRFFAMAAPQPVTLNSEPVTIQVDPLPPGKPEGFTGVVGRLTAKASADRVDVKAGEAVTLSVAVSGTGNLKSLPEPRLPDVPSLRFFTTESSSSIDKANDRVGGSKTFRTVAVPRVSGAIRVPPFSFPYFDPERKAYARAETAPIDLRVAPGAAGAAPSAAAPAQPAGLTAIADDIRYLKTADAAGSSSALAAFADLGPWHAIPFAFLLAAAAVAWRRRADEADPRGRRRREALGRAEARLASAAALPESEAAKAAALAADALAGYVADQLDAPAAGLTLKSALEGLKTLRRPPAAGTLERLTELWREAEVRRFAPGGARGDAARFSHDASSLLKSLDQELRR